MNIDVSIDEKDLLSAKSLFKEHQGELRFKKFLPSLLNLGVTVLFTIIIFLFVFIINGNKGINTIIDTEDFTFVILNLIFVICFFVILMSIISFILSKVSMKKMYITKYKYLIGDFSAYFVDNELILDSSSRKIKILLKGCKVKKENDLLILRDKNKFMVTLPLYKVDDRKSLEAKIYECIGEKNL